jgi:predicted nuclease of predicted toxin-antitoxin system
MPALPACLDECTHLRLLEALTARGYDVTSIQVVGPRAALDPVVLARATELGRVLITHNVADFRAADEAFRRAGRRHAGIIGVPQLRGAPFSRLELRVAMMLDWVGAQPDASRLFAWGELQRLLERGVRLPGYSEDEVRHALGRA